MKETDTESKQRKDALFLKKEHGITRMTDEQLKTCDAFCADYMAFLQASKTEREANANAIALLEQRGYVPFVPGMT